MSRRDSISSNMSRASFIREVDMAQDEVRYVYSEFVRALDSLLMRPADVFRPSLR